MDGDDSEERRKDGEILPFTSKFPSSHTMLAMNFTFNPQSVIVCIGGTTQKRNCRSIFLFPVRTRLTKTRIPPLVIEHALKKEVSIQTIYTCNSPQKKHLLKIEENLDAAGQQTTFSRPATWHNFVARLRLS